MKNSFLAENRKIRFSRDPQIDGIEGCHDNNAGEKIADLKLHMDQAGDASGQSAG